MAVDRDILSVATPQKGDLIRLRKGYTIGKVYEVHEGGVSAAGFSWSNEAVEVILEPQNGR